MSLSLAALCMGSALFFETPITYGAHRGGYSHAPESTLAAFRETNRRFPKALLESDVAMTADGQLVLLHDETVDRTTDGTGRISDLTMAQVRRLDAGYRYTRDGGKTYPFRGRGLTIPTLQEVLRRLPRARFFLDLKPTADAAKVVAQIRAERATDRVLLASFLPAKMAQVRELAPEIATCYDATQGLALLAALRGGDWASYRAQAPVLSLMVEHVEQYKITKAEVAKIRAKGILVQIHTLDSTADVQRWRAFGVDGFLSGNIELLRNE